jgi:hypothetical protein
MLIQYYGDYCFKITTKPGGRATEDITLWTDPYNKTVGARAPQGQADIVLISHASGIDTNASSLKGNPVILDTPGEYAAKGINILGVPSFQDMEDGARRGQNTLFVFQAEGMNLCFLGALGHELTPSQIEKMDHVDILFIPIGNHDTLATKQLDDLIRKVEPAIVIPMHYKIVGLSLSSIGDEKAFCNEVGNCPPNKITKLNIKKKDLEGKSMEIVLLEKA